MYKMIKFPSIEQFRNVVRNVQHRAQYVGMDDNGDPIMNRHAVMPTLEFEGTCKLHGTNASVCVDQPYYDAFVRGIFGNHQLSNMWFQSRERIISPEKDNAGFAMFGVARKAVFFNIANSVIDLCFEQKIPTTDKTIAIFGEFCGGAIQKGVALNQVNKMFVIFGIALADADGQKVYLTRDQVQEVLKAFVTKPSAIIDGDMKIYSIYDFPTWKFTIDFENPHHSQNELNAVMEEVENECPVGKAFGVSGVGEGIVIRCITPGWEDSGYWAKIKGEKHSKSKVKTLATVDVDRIDNIKELAERVANNGRLEQMAQNVFDLLNGGEVEMEMMGPFIRAVMQDIAKEELDVIAASGFTMKEINGPVSKICRNFVMQNMEV